LHAQGISRSLDICSGLLSQKGLCTIGGKGKETVLMLSIGIATGNGPIFIGNNYMRRVPGNK
jgi:hypothetical protein